MSETIHGADGRPLLPALRGPDVLVQPRPFSAYVRQVTLPVGSTVLDAVAAAGIPNSLLPFVRVWIDDLEIDRQYWRGTRPKPGRHIFVRVVPLGGGGGGGERKNVLASVLMLVVSVAASAFAPMIAGALFPTLSGAGLAFATAGLGAGLSLLGALAVSALIPPPRQDNFAGQRALVAGVRNQFTPYGNIPRIFGKRRVYPVQAARPYTEAVGDKRWLRVLLLVGWGPLRISNIRIGETPIASFPNIEIATREGWHAGHADFGILPGGVSPDLPQTLFTQSVREDTFSVLLPDAGRDASDNPINSAGAWVTRTTLTNTDEISIDVTAISGLASYTSEGKRKDLTIEVDVEWRAVGAPSWTPVVWDGNDAADGTQTNGRLILKDSSAAPVVRGGRWEVPAGGQYQVRMRRRTPDQIDRYVDTIHWTTLRSITGQFPVQAPGVATIAMRIKATDQFQSLPDTINCEVESYLPTGTAPGSLAWAISRSPADAYADLLRRRGTERMMPDSRIDWPSVALWRSSCATTAPNAAEPLWQFDGSIDGGSLFDALRRVANSARADYILRDGLHSVVHDVAQAAPVQHITPRNSWGYSGRKAFIDRPHALRISFPNAEQGWQTDEVIVYDDGYTAANADRFEALELPDATSSTQCWRDGRFMLATGKLRPEEHTVFMDIENLRCTKGDQVVLAHDVLAVGVVSARVKTLVTSAGNITGLTLDSTFGAVAGQAYALRARRADGSILLLPMANYGASATTATVTLASPILTASGPAVGDLCTVGETTRETAPMKIKAIEPGPDFTAKLTLVDDQPGVYSATTGAIPPYVTNVNTTTIADQGTPPTPTILLRSDESAIEYTVGGGLMDRIAVGISPLPSSRVQIGRVEVMWRPAGTGPWRHAPGSPAAGDQRVFFITPVEGGSAYDVRARLISSARIPSAWAYSMAHTVVGKTTVPAAVTGFTATPQLGAILLTWNANPEIDIRDYEIRRGSSWATGTVVAKSVRSLEFSAPDRTYAPVTFWIKARDVIGLVSATAASATETALGVTTSELDQTPPVMTGGVTLTSSLVGTAGRARLVATWAAATAANGLAGYDVRIRQGAGNDVSQFAGETRAEWDVIAGVSYTVSVRARDRIGNVSAWTAEATHVAATDTVPPAVPTGLSVTAGIRHLWLTWAANTEADFAQYEVFESASTTAPTAGSTPTFSLLGTATVRSGLGDSTQRHYWIRAVDTSGNRSAWSARVSGTTVANAGITSAQLIGLVNQGSFALGLTPIEILAVLPTTGNFEGRQVLLTTDGKQYRYVSGAWTREVDGEDIKAYSIKAVSMEIGAIGADQIATRALSARHFAVGNFINLVPDNDLQDAASWSNLSFFSVYPTSSNTGRASKGEIRYDGVKPVTAATASDSIRFAVTPGETLVCSFDMGRLNGTTHSAGARLRFGAHDLTLIDAPYIGFTSNEPAGSTKTFTAKIVVPPGAFNCSFRWQVNAGTDGDVRFWAPVVRRANEGEMIVDGSLKANHMSATDVVISGSAQIELGIITNGHIIDLQAEKITVGAMNAGITVGATGVNIGTVESRAADPAARVNAAATVIEPGKIRISGTTTLSDWRMGGDETHINGGEISANTIAANALTVGNRNITFTGLQFEFNSPSANRVSWTAGTIQYINNAGVATTANITAGNFGWTSGVIYLFWAQGATTISGNVSLAVASGPNNVMLGTYSGGTNLFVTYGRTVIDGSGIKTGTVTADRVNTTSFAASGLALFGGNLQSTNFSSGAAGWRITQAGNAEFNNLIVRSSMQFGAVTDQWQSISTTARKAPGSVVTVASINVTDLPQGGVFNYSLAFEASGLGLPSSNPDSIYDLAITFLRRVARFGGAIGGYQLIQTWQIPFDQSAFWMVFESAGVMSGYVDECEFLVQLNSPVSGAAYGNCFRNCYLDLRRVAR